MGETSVNIVLVSDRPWDLGEFLQALEQESTVRIVDRANATRAVAWEGPVDLAVIHAGASGQGNGDSARFALVEELLRVNAMINTAVCSALRPEDFHEQSEGLGILAQLPPSPGAEDARTLLDRLRSLA
jgi:hypothetical protein